MNSDPDENNMDEDELDVEYQRVTELISLGKFDDALTKLQPMLDKNPENPGLMLDAGYIYANLGDFEKSIAMYSKTIELVPDSASGYTGLGFVYNMQGMFEKALEQFKKGLKCSPDNALIHFEIGETYLEIDEFDKALKAYYKAIQFGGAETEAETLHRIAQVHLGLNEPDKALEVANNVLRSSPDYRTIYYIMAGAESMKENWDKAKEYLEEFLKFYPEDEDAKEMLEHVKEHLE